MIDNKEKLDQDEHANGLSTPEKNVSPSKSQQDEREMDKLKNLIESRNVPNGEKLNRIMRDDAVRKKLLDRINKENVKYIF